MYFLKVLFFAPCAVLLRFIVFTIAETIVGLFYAWNTTTPDIAHHLWLKIFQAWSKLIIKKRKVLY